MPIPSSRPILGAAVAALTLFLLPATASALTARLNEACYTHVPTAGSQPVVISLTGGTPNADFLVSATVPGAGDGSAGSTEGTFDAAGNATATLTDIAPPSGTIDPTRGQRILLSIRDYGAGGTEVSIGQTLVTTLSLRVNDHPTNPRARRRVSVSGTPFAHRRVYGFIVKAHGRRVLRRISLGRGDLCGFTSRRAVVAPRGFHPGSYRFYVNAGRRLNRRLALHTSFTIERRLF